VRIVIDTNIWVSGLLWRGMPWNLLRLAEARHVEMCITPVLLAELASVLEYPRLQPRLRQLRLAPQDLVVYALNLSSVFEVGKSTDEPIVTADPDDDIVLLCAVAADAGYVVSGDQHLLSMVAYSGIPIVTIRGFLDREFPDQVIE
jgi:hypothetical protein